MNVIEVFEWVVNVSVEVGLVYVIDAVINLKVVIVVVMFEAVLKKLIIYLVGKVVVFKK